MNKLNVKDATVLAHKVFYSIHRSASMNTLFIRKEQILFYFINKNADYSAQNTVLFFWTEKNTGFNSLKMTGLHICAMSKTKTQRSRVSEEKE